MKKFLLRFLIFCLLPMPFLYALNYMVDTGLKKSHSYNYKEWNDIFNGRVNAELLILGASRAFVHISPKILDSELKVNSYNIGLDASQFLMQYERFKLYIKYNKNPKYLIESVDFTTFTEGREVPFPDQFLPYLSNPDIRRITAGFDNSFSWPQLYFPLFKYNNKEDIFINGLKNYFGKATIDTPFKYKGYIGVKRNWDDSFDNYKKQWPNGQKLVLSSKSMAAFKSFILYCNANQIKLILVFSPVYHESLKYILNGSDIIGFYKNCSKIYHVPFLNYSRDTMGYHLKYFYNSQHLNKQGSEIFSKHLSADLKSIIINDKKY